MYFKQYNKAIAYFDWFFFRRLCQSLLVRKRQGALPGQEVIRRHGLADPDSFRLQTVEGVGIVRRCAVEEKQLETCGSGQFLCSTCKLYFCDLHGSSHHKHNYWYPDAASNISRGNYFLMFL